MTELTSQEIREMAALRSHSATGMVASRWGEGWAQTAAAVVVPEERTTARVALADGATRTQR